MDARANTEEAPPSDGSGSARRWFPGYTVAGAAAVATVASAPGQTFLISQWNGPLREAFGIGELALNSSYALATVAASLPLVLVGRLADRLGPRRALTICAAAFGLSCLALSAVTGFAGVIAAFFLLRLFGQGSLPMISQHALAMWFHRRLGTIQGLKHVVVFGAWSAAPPLALLLIDALGWRGAYVAFALLIWIVVVPVAWFAVRDRPEDIGLRLDDDAPPTGERRVARSAPASSLERELFALEEPCLTLSEALRTRAYWTLAAAAVLPALVGTALLFDAQPILAVHGMGAAAAAGAVSAWTAVMALMAIPSGHLTDRFRAAHLIPAGIVAIASASILLGFAHSPFAAAVAFATFAVGQSLLAGCTSATIARYFGRPHHGAIRSSVIRLSVLGTGLGPLITGASAHLTGGYTAAIGAFLLLCAVPLALAPSLRPPGH